MNLISTQEAAEQKGISRQGIIKAIDRGEIDGQRLSARSMVVIVNKKFETWQPNPNMQKGGRARWSTSKDKPTKKARRSA